MAEGSVGVHVGLHEWIGTELGVTDGSTLAVGWNDGVRETDGLDEGCALAAVGAKLIAADT